MTRFYAIEFTDEEGEQVIKHLFMTEKQRDDFISNLMSNGIHAEIHDLTPPQVVENTISGVLYQDEEPRLE